jgi:hypothetical protein
MCDASVRYEPAGITLDSVVEANRSTMEIGGVVMKALYPSAVRETQDQPKLLYESLQWRWQI